MQKIILIGHLGRDPELKYTQNQNAICSFSVAVSEKYKDKQSTEWFNCTAFGKTAEACSKYIKKGSQVYIEGKQQTSSYKAKDGSNAKSIKLVVNEIQFLSSIKSSSGDTTEDSQQSPEDWIPEARENNSEF